MLHLEQRINLEQLAAGEGKEVRDRRVPARATIHDGKRGISNAARWYPWPGYRSTDTYRPSKRACRNALGPGQ